MPNTGDPAVAFGICARDRALSWHPHGRSRPAEEAPMRILASLLALTLVLTSCGGGVSSGTRDDPNAPLAMEDIPRTLDTYLERLVRRIDRTATDLDRQLPATAIRRRTLQMRIRSATMAQDVRHRSNALVALVETWHWVTALDIHNAGSAVKAAYGEHVDILLATSSSLRQEIDDMARRALNDDAKYKAMRDDIIKAVANGDIFSPTADQHSEFLDQFLSATHLESVLSLPLAPFTALNGIGRGADAVGELVKVADRGVDLAELYPQILSWQLQLVLVEVEERQITQQVVADLHSASQAATSVAETAKELPTRVRQEVVTLLDQSQGAQATAQQTLKDTQQAAAALDGAARSLDQAVRSLDGFIAGLKPKPGEPEPKPGEPFRIQDYTQAAQAIGGAVKELNTAVASLQQAMTSPAVTAQTKATADYAAAAMDRAIDHLAWRAIQVALVAAAGFATAFAIARGGRRRADRV